MELLAFIKELLLLNDCVIIPGFGGFVSNYQPAGFHGARFTPPSKTVSFNKKLNFNDGLFVNYIADKEGMNYFLASRKINLLVEEMNYRLTDGEEISVPEIGTLRYDDHENLIFVPRINGNLNADAYGLTAFSYESLLATKKIVHPVPQIRKDAAQVVFRKRTLQKVMIAVPLVLALALTPVKNYKSYLQESNLGSITEMITSAPAVAAPAVVAAKVSRAAEEVKQPLENYTYFIIGGSFKNDENAVNFFGRLKEDGYAPVDLGMIKGLHYIAVEGFSALKEAQDAHREYLSKLPDSGAWIYIKK